jgi:hypothetical protein
MSRMTPSITAELVIVGESLTLMRAHDYEMWRTLLHTRPDPLSADLAFT